MLISWKQAGTACDALSVKCSLCCWKSERQDGTSPKSLLSMAVYEFIYLHQATLALIRIPCTILAFLPYKSLLPGPHCGWSTSCKRDSVRPWKGELEGRNAKVVHEILMRMPLNKISPAASVPHALGRQGDARQRYLPVISRGSLQSDALLSSWKASKERQGHDAQGTFASDPA